MRKKDSIFRLRSIPRFLCCLMFASWPPGPASSPARPCPVFFAALLAPPPPPALASPGPSRPRTRPGLRQLQPAASCGRRLLAKTCLGWQPKDGPTSPAPVQEQEQRFQRKRATTNILLLDLIILKYIKCKMKMYAKSFDRSFFN